MCRHLMTEKYYTDHIILIMLSTYMYPCSFVCVYVCVSVSMCACVSLSVRGWVHACMCIHVFVYECVQFTHI